MAFEPLAGQRYVVNIVVHHESSLRMNMHKLLSVI